MKIETKLSARLCQFKHCNGGREWVETIRCAGCAAGGQRTRWWGAPPFPARPHRLSGPLPPLLPVPRVRRWRRTAPRCRGACGRRRVCGEGTQAGRRRPLPRNGGAEMRGRALGGGGGSGARGQRVPPFGPGDAELGERVAGVPSYLSRYPFGWTPDIVRLNHDTVPTWRTIGPVWFFLELVVTWRRFFFVIRVSSYMA